ncbi:MAG TPA: hypothetical protein VFP84_11050 [Kofleriaceae bacterium]|nr:hypothetical protein [Kofleriaceae bacterium]
MADVILRLRVDPATGKRELVIEYASDADALPIEHEHAHRAIADRVVAGGLASAAVEVARGAEPAAEIEASPVPAAAAVPRTT